MPSKSNHRSFDLFIFDYLTFIYNYQTTALFINNDWRYDNFQDNENDYQTRMHSSRIRTARSLPYRGGSLSGRPPLKGTWDQRQTPLEGTWDQAARQEVTSYRPPPQKKPRMTHASKNVTLPQTSFASGKMLIIMSVRTSNVTKSSIHWVAPVSGFIS